MGPQRRAVPQPLRETASFVWRLLVIAAAVGLVGYVLSKISLVSIAVGAAALVAALLSPASTLLQRAGAPRAVAAGLTFVTGLTGIGVLAWFLYGQLSSGLDGVRSSLLDGLDAAVRWLEDGPLSLDEIDLDQVTANATDWLQDNSDDVAEQAVTVAGTVTQVLGGVALALFVGFFLLYDGRRMWLWSVGLLPRRMRHSADDAGQHAWQVLIAYMRGTVIVAVFDAALIGVGLAVLGVPLAVPLSALIFLGAFVPLVGATVTGALAVLVALATGGLTTALLVLAVILVVQQVEGNVLQPFLLGHMVQIHPVAIVVAVSAGSIVAGIPGAVFAVPVVAMVNAAGSRLAQATTSD